MAESGNIYKYNRNKQDDDVKIDVLFYDNRCSTISAVCSHRLEWLW